MAETSLKRVLIIQAELKRYRVPFFTKLHALLRERNVELLVAYSGPNSIHAKRKDSAELPSEFGRKVPGRWFFDKFVYQGLWREIFKADLVIVGPEVKYLNNPALLILSALRLKRVAYWGLGPNNHPDRSPFAEWLKRFFFTCVDWWFAYTESIAAYLRNEGMDPSRITVVQNATDSAELTRLLDATPVELVERRRLELTGSTDAVIGLYCGMIGEIKSIPLLLEAARLVHARRPDFHLVIIGNGSLRAWLENAVENDPWIHYLGSQYGTESALFYKMANLFLLAGTAGLSVVDSFAAGLPLFITELPTHPPEISYVVNGYNGVLAPHDAASLAQSILSALEDPALMHTLREGARESGKRFTMEAMVGNYGAGVLQCLERYDDRSKLSSGKEVLTS